ncbi:MAG: fumarate hydratase [Opitutae bacterium]|nr:fumarate hydratase [Opitutae bacterium]
MSSPEFSYREPFPLGEDKTEYALLSPDYVETTEFEGKPILKIQPEALTMLAQAGMRDIAFFLRAEHLGMVAAILDDAEASGNDRNVAMTLLKNAEVSSHGILPFCQDTGTAIIVAHKGQQVWTGANDAEYLSKGIYNTYIKENLRYSQNVPLDMYQEINSGTNLPAQIDIYSTEGMEYEFLFIAKGGGSANKTFFYQKTRATLRPVALEKFLLEQMSTLGTAACPPYHVAFVVGGTSAEANLKHVKIATTRYYDALPTKGNEHGQAFRDVAMENKLLEASRKLGYGAQFGGKYFALDLRVIRLPRHGASCPIGMGVSCSADRQMKAKINADGIWMEKLETNPGRFIPDHLREADYQGVVQVDLNCPMKEILAQLSSLKVETQLSLTGTIIVARDIAHAKLMERLEKEGDLPDYFKNHPVYYAGPAKTPEGMPSGSFGPTTAGRMDSYVEPFQAMGGSMVMLAKGNRSRQVADACQKHGGFYLGSIGGPAAILAQDNIRKVELIEYEELGMEAIYRIEVENFPAFILIDDKGNDFFRGIRKNCEACVAAVGAT